MFPHQIVSGLMEDPTADLVGKRRSMPTPLPSSSILLIKSSPARFEMIHRYLPAAMVETCSSFEDSVTYMPLHLYQVVIYPQRLASYNQYSLLRLNRIHHPCSPFIVTMEREEVADVRQAIEQGALGFLHGNHDDREHHLHH